MRRILVAVAEISVRVDLHHPEAACTCGEIALHDAPGDGVLAAQDDRHLAAPQDLRHSCRDVRDHPLRLPAAVDGRPRVDAFGPGVARTVPALELTGCGEDGCGAVGRPAAIRDRLLVGNGQDVEARRLRRDVVELGAEKPGRRPLLPRGRGAGRCALHDSRLLNSS
jgi:hypothetical protein